MDKNIILFLFLLSTAWVTDSSANDYGELEVNTVNSSEYKLNIKNALSFEYHDVNHKSPYFLGSSLSLKEKYFSARNDLELRLQWNKIVMQSTLRARSMNKNDSFSSYINQLYYDDKNEYFSWTFGKKVISWGVGHGFRPLDVIQNENRRLINPPALIGIPLISLEKFSDSSAWSLVWTNPVYGNSESKFSKSESLALRYFRFSENYDFHVVGKFSKEKKAEGGLGVTYIVNENTSLYSSALYTKRYSKMINNLIDSVALYSVYDPMKKTYYSNGLRSNVGFQWTGNSGFGVLLEAYYDGQAYGKKDWKRLNLLTKNQLLFSDLIPDYVLESNIAWSSRAFVQDNLVRENFLLRFSFDNSDGFKPYVDFLYSPNDGGVLSTVSVVYEKNNQRYSLGFRNYAGKRDSVFRNVPEKNVTWFRMDLTF